MDKTFASFDQFWEAMTRWCKSGNHPTFHPCCQVWTTRLSKKSQLDHISAVKWRKLFSTPEAKAIPQKEYLRTHMHQYSWGEPIRVNFHCSCSLNSKKSQIVANNQPQLQAFPGAFQFHEKQASSPSVHSSRPAYEGVVFEEGTQAIESALDSEDGCETKNYSSMKR